MQNDILGQADSYRQADNRYAADPDLKVRTALDRAADKIGLAFKYHPKLEAAIRRTIGNSYSGVGETSQAIANLEAICRQHLKGNYQLEIVDVFEQPLRALADGVIVTPSLIKLSPLPAAQVVGNLSDRGKVLLALGLQGKTP
jgi:circadian clock protein KaiB